MRKLVGAIAHDERGNVLFISAISILVLMMLGGSALDVSRMYLVKTRLQQACDAGVLAYRRSMKGTNVTPDTWPTAKTYFNANYTPGRYGTSDPIFPEPTVDANVVVHGVASVVVPMTLMKFFGKDQATLETRCDAQLQLSNTDVMFVLDTTGSMTGKNAGDSEDRITSLRKAVTGFYNTLEGAKVAGTQVRYGFVPYSNTVNVGMLLKRDWMVNIAYYQSRMFVKQTREQTGTQGEYVTSYSGWKPALKYTQTITYGDPENCISPKSTAKATNTRSDPWLPSSTAVPRTQISYRTYGGDSYSATINSNGQCQITRNSYPSQDQQETATYDRNKNAGDANTVTRNYWTYQQLPFDVRDFKGSAANGLMAGGRAKFYTENSKNFLTPEPLTFTWNSSNACIEERQTLRSGESGTAWDMDVDSVPNPMDPDTQWRPFIPNIVFARAVGSYSGTASTWAWSPAAKTVAGDYARLSSQSSLTNACPSPARKLQTKEDGLGAGQLKSYLDSLATRGWTYHDIGFLWGLRLISREGLFAPENTSAPNGSSIGRNIIFMTDGDTETHIQAYDAYGLSALDRRRTSSGSLPTDADQDAIVEDRLSRYCTIAKEQKGITVWVIAFGTTLTSMLENCASQGRAFQADNANELNDTFAEIAAKIAQLRITK